MVIEKLPVLEVPRNFSSDFLIISLISCAEQMELIRIRKMRIK